MYINKELEQKIILRDDDGGFWGIEITMNYKKTLLIGIYAPNRAKEKLFYDIEKRIGRVKL